MRVCHNPLFQSTSPLNFLPKCSIPRVRIFRIFFLRNCIRCQRKKEASTKGLGFFPKLLLLKVYPVKLCDVKAKNVFTTKLYSVAAYPRTHSRSLSSLTLFVPVCLFLTLSLRLYVYFISLVLFFVPSTYLCLAIDFFLLASLHPAFTFVSFSHFSYRFRFYVYPNIFAFTRISSVGRIFFYRIEIFPSILLRTI